MEPVRGSGTGAQADAEGSGRQAWLRVGTWKWLSEFFLLYLYLIMDIRISI